MIGTLKTFMIDFQMAVVKLYVPLMSQMITKKKKLWDFPLNASLFQSKSCTSLLVSQKFMPYESDIITPVK